ncbi:glycosyltransferase family 4 protein [Roseomonas elaeocarpi]|uniref:Glycosyltransferase family 4 protein n=1 Tax=Roseomonas elaeocarpi TaxID=907779 RepID=A0ABV6JWX9_9PROT
MSGDIPLVREGQTKISATTPHIVLDVSRLLASGGKMAPSGIDRVEFAYARRWAGLPASRCTFVAGTPAGGWSVLPHAAVVELVVALSAAWSGQLEGEPGPEAQAAKRLAGRLRLRTTLGLGVGSLRSVLNRPGPKAFLLVSHRALERQGPIRALRARGCAFVPLIHDLIPATHPEYARPGQSGRHLRRIATTAALADGVIANSLDTANVLAPHLRARALPPPVLVAPLGIEPPAPIPGPPVRQEPYFITIGTIEPRKNHLLLLHLWRDLVRVYGAETPRLLIVGRRGWENENIVDILDRSAVLRGTVHELGQLPDRRVSDLLRGARALLFPSFVEGYGLPLAEALALGVPAICSDLPALREVGGTVPDYLDPLDGAGWRELVLDYAQPDSPARAAQLSRLEGWHAPGWDDHFRRVDALLARVTGCETPGGAARQAKPPEHDLHESILTNALVSDRTAT